MILLLLKVKILPNFQICNCLSLATDKPDEMRSRKRRLLIRLIIGLGLMGIYVHASLQSYAHYTDRFWAPVVVCQNSDLEMEQLLNLAYKVHKILEDMKIRHWLMYGSIWGALRIGKPLPWDNDVDLGFDGEGRFAEMTLPEFLAPFKAAGFKVVNKWTQSGTIVIHKEGLRLSLDLFAFYNHGGTMRRTGLESWFFPINYRTYHSFPAKLVEPELPQVKFGFFNISVPKGGIEIMKHLYPYNWWKEVRPGGC